MWNSEEPYNPGKKREAKFAPQVLTDIGRRFYLAWLKSHSSAMPIALTIPRRMLSGLLIW
jgi:hypothetical protein